MPALKRKRGFTLIELLIVFSLMAMISGAGFASLVAYSRSQTLSQATADFRQAVEQTRFNALSNLTRNFCSSSNILTSYRLVMCTNGYNPASLCTNEGIANNRGYIIRQTCSGGQEQTVHKKSYPNLTITSGCDEVRFAATTAVFTGLPAANFPCTVSFTGYSNTKNAIIDAQGYTR